MKIGTVLTKLRKRKGFTQQELAVKIGVTRTTISLIESESSDQRPNSQTMKKLCKALEISEAFIYFLSIEEEDVPEEKRGFYKSVAPALDSLIHQVFESE